MSSNAASNGWHMNSNDAATLGIICNERGKMSEKRNFSEKLTEIIGKIAGPLTKFSEITEVSAIVEGLISNMPVVVVGSIFLILYVLGTPSVGASGKALLPFLTPLAYKFVGVNTATIGFLALYSTITIAYHYGRKLKIDPLRSVLIALVTFLLFNYDAAADLLSGALTTSAFSASNLIVGMFVVFVSVRIYWFCLKNNIVVKMPEGVPPNIANSFGALIPLGISFTLAWLVRSIIGFNASAWMSTIFQPVSEGADNVFVFSGLTTLAGALWSVGIHGDNLITPIVEPLGQMWLAENTAALASGVSIYNLPRVAAGMLNTGLWTVSTRAAAYQSLLVLLLLSKARHLRDLGLAVLPSTLFNITEPILFGTPIMLNPFLMVPFLLNNFAGPFVGYLLNSLPIFGKFSAAVSWATPLPLLITLGTGDWKTILVYLGCLAVGIVIYLPFFREYEKDSVQKMAESSEE